MARNDRRGGRPGDLTMNTILRTLTVAAALALVAGCAKQETVVDPARPVVLAQVVAGSGSETSVFAGEVKPRYESDLAFRIGGKIIERFVDAGARVREGQARHRLDPADT